MTDKDFVPKIDLSSLLINGVKSPQSFDTIQEIKKACEDVGFFTVINHGIPHTSIEKIYSNCKKFFSLPLKNKLSFAPNKWNKENDTVYRGYFPSTVNGKEGLDIGDPLLTTSMKELTQKNKFEVNHDMSLIDGEWQLNVNNYYNQVFSLGIILFKALIGCETHVDSGIMTILYQDKKGGLQVQNRNNLQWYDVPYELDSLVINSGLALQFLTNDYFKATNHRVLINKEERISIPFFFEPSYDFDLNPKYLGITDKPIHEINNYEFFLTQSLRKFTEYDRNI